MDTTKNEIYVIDSHTEGEPTRLVVGGLPPLGMGSAADMCQIFSDHHSDFRSFVLNEPRGFDAVVGALLCEPSDEEYTARLIFFTNIGVLGMCGHGAIGAAVTLAHMGKINVGTHKFETPVGIVTVELLDRNRAMIQNVPSFVHLENVELAVDGLGGVTGDIAWGGNWFFLTDSAPCALESKNISLLTDAAWKVRRALRDYGYRGDDGAEIDHIEFFDHAPGSAVDSRNFVLCPGGAYDRSPCGTGTSAKLACLAAEGSLMPGDRWVQESIMGGRFTAQFTRGENGSVLPEITGSAWVTSESKFIYQPGDPFPTGLAPLAHAS